MTDARATGAGRVAAWSVAAIVFGAGVLALLRPGVAGLAALRLGSMGLIGWLAAPSLVARPPAVGGGLLALGLLIAGLSWSAPVAEACAQATAAAGERRFALATVPGLGFVLAPLAAAVAVGGVTVPLFVAAGVFGRGRPLVALLLLPGVAVAYGLGAPVYRLGRRWLVLVPSGVVVHDPMLFDDTYRLAPDEVGAVALTARGWRARLDAPDVLDATAGVERALWIGLTTGLGAPRSRPGIRRPDGPVRHVFCAPVLRAEAAAALAAKGYLLGEPIGAP